MYEFTPTVLAIYLAAMVALFFVELCMFWGGCAVADQDTPSWQTSILVVLPIFVLTVALFEVVCRFEDIHRYLYGKGIDMPAVLQPYGIGLVPFAVIVGSLAGWLLALAIYIPMVTKLSLSKGFWVATGQVVFRSVIVLLLAAVGLVFGATYQVNTVTPKPETPSATSKPN